LYQSNRQVRRQRRNPVKVSTATGIALYLLLTASSQSQTLPSGIIDVPPLAIGNIQGVGSNTTVNIGEGGTVGYRFYAGLFGTPNTDVEVNVTGGTIGDIFSANAGSTVNISGGRFGATFTANSGSTINLMGGVIGNNYLAFAGSSTNISGGTLSDGYHGQLGSTTNLTGGSMGYGIVMEWGSNMSFTGGGMGPGFHARQNSNVVIYGAEFQLNGQPFTDLTITLGEDDNFTGTLADGSVFVFDGADDSLVDVELVAVPLPAIDTTPIVVNTLNPTAPKGLRQGQTLTLQEGGKLVGWFGMSDATLVVEGGSTDHIKASGSSILMNGGSTGDLFRAYAQTTVNLNGGTIGEFAEFYGDSTLEINSGQIGSFLNVYDSTVTINGGSVGEYMRAFDGSVVNVNGGTVGNSYLTNNSQLHLAGGFIGDVELSQTTRMTITDGQVRHRVDVRSGAELVMDGGWVGGQILAQQGSVVRLRGGNIGSGLSAQGGSDVEIHGGQFELNGVAYTGSTISLTGNDVFTGTYANGDPFLYTRLTIDQLSGVKLVATSLPAIDTTPIVVDESNPLGPTGLQTGQSLTLKTGGELRGNFTLNNASLQIQGGKAQRVEAYHSTVSLSGHNVTNAVAGLEGSEITISGNSSVRRLELYPGSKAHIAGGDVGELIEIKAGSELTISGGTVRGIKGFPSGSPLRVTGGILVDALRVNEGNLLEVSGGTFQQSFRANPGSNSSFAGGNVGGQFIAFRGSNLSITGGEFELNGVPFAGSEINLARGDVFTGTYADGSPFLFSFEQNDPMNSETSERAVAATSDRLFGVKLVSATLPSYDTAPVVIDGEPTASPFGLRRGQTLTLKDGGRLAGRFAVNDATLNIDGGSTDRIAAYLSNVNISSGSVGAGFQAFPGSNVRITGGIVGSNFECFAGCDAAIEGGTLGNNMLAHPGSTVQIHGGSIGNAARVQAPLTMDGGRIGNTLQVANTTVKLHGGSVGDDFDLKNSVLEMTGGIVGRRLDVDSKSTFKLIGGNVGGAFNSNTPGTTEITGGEFRKNGVAYVDSTISLAKGDIFTGTLADGSPFLFANVLSNTGDTLNAVKLVSSPLPAADLTPIVVDSSAPSTLFGLRAGQSLTVRQGGALLGSVSAFQASLELQDGSIEHLEVYQSEVKIGGGSVGSDFNVHSGSSLHLTGGSVGSGARLYGGSVATIRGGTMGKNFRIDANNQLHMSGGVVGDMFLLSGSTAEISGGSIGDNFHVANASSVLLSGGSIGEELSLDSGSTLTMTGGSIGDYGIATSGGVLNMEGGAIGKGFRAFNGSVVNISGGRIGSVFSAYDNSTINLFGHQFYLNGQPVQLELDETILLSERGQVLSGILADGSPFALDIFEYSSNHDYFAANATLTLTRVSLAIPEPNTVLMMIVGMIAIAGGLRRHRHYLRP
jgi:hypothetical protein